jgi:alpha-tubulin suppressor-like RCC1 family protein
MKKIALVFIGLCFLYSFSYSQKIYGGANHSLSICNDSTVMVVGSNYFGQLGDGTTQDKNNPVKIDGLTSIIAVSGGGWHSLFLKNDGTVWAVGRNIEGQLGDGTTNNRTIPVQVNGLSDIIR